MNEKDYLLLQYISEEQSLAKVAERLYITQPALTYRLQQIEKDFGVSILFKNVKGNKLTPEGEYLVQYAKKMMAELIKTKDYVANMGKEVRGNLRIGAASYFGLHKLPPILKNFSGQYPEVQIHVASGLSSEIFDLLLKEEIHVGIVRGDYHWIYKKHLISEENICVISQDEIRLEDLPKIPRIDHQGPKQVTKSTSYALTPVNKLINDWWNERFNQPPMTTMQVDTFETCKEMVKNGLGYAIIPSIFVKPSDGLHMTYLVRKNGEEIKRNTWMLYKESSLELNVVGKFVDYIKNA